MTAPRTISIVQYWGGCPQVANSKWQRFLHVLRACAARGWQTHIVWSRLPDDTALWKPFADAGCGIHLQPRPARNFDPACMQRVRRLCRDVGCDIFHCHNVHTSPMVGAALAGVPVRIWSALAMSPWYERGVRPTGLHRFLASIRATTTLATRVFAISTPVRQELIEQGVPASRVQVVPVPIDVARFASATAGDSRQRLDLRGDDLVITTVGRAVPLKGWDVLLAAFVRAFRANERVHLLLVGSTDAPEEAVFARQLRETVSRAGLEHRVHLLGQRRDIPAILKASDIFAFPSRSDGQGLALTEALAAGLPCVAARVGGIPDVVTDGHNGLLFPRDDAAALADALMRLAGDTAMRRRLGQAACDSARRFRMEAYVETQIGAYESLLAGQRSRSGLGFGRQGFAGNVAMAGLEDRP